LGARLVIGWGVATGASLLGLYVTPKLDLPIGATIVCALGAVLALTALATQCRHVRNQNK
jgi:ABC-type Mn2+/Zn2+ transport system permease subunit